MPSRAVPLVTDQTYHILNKGNASLPIFRNKYDYQKFIQAFLYYQNATIPFRFSKLTTLPTTERDNLLDKLNKQKDFLVEIIAYCLMPNHYHFILTQKKDEGIMNFIRRFTSSYSHYFNTKYKRKGTLFQDRFKAIRIESDSQLIHLTRYLHLNPYSSFLVKDIKHLFDYPFSSLKEYLETSEMNICNKDKIFSFFKNSQTYRDSIVDRAGYQRTLEEIKHKILEE